MRKKILVNRKAFINLSLLGLSLILSWSLIDYFLTNKAKTNLNLVSAASGVCEYVKWPSAELNAIPVSITTTGAVIVTSSPIYVSNANIGIGTNNPRYKLDVVGTTSVSSLCLGGVCRSSWPTPGTNYWQLNGNNLYPSSVNYNVGIGTTSSPYKLSVFSQNGDPAFYINFDNLSNFGIYRSQILTNSVVLRNYNGNGLSLMSLKKGEFVNPAQLGLIVMRVLSTISEPIYDENGNYLGESEYEIIDNYVGIGTDTPRYKLDVVGTTSVSSLCLGGVCRSSWPTDSFWKLSGNNLSPNQKDWLVGIGSANPLGKFYVKSDLYVPGIFEMANPNGSGLVLELRKSFSDSNKEDPYISFVKQTASGSIYKMFGYFQVGEEGIKIVPKEVLFTSVDERTGLGRRQYLALTTINPYGGEVRIGSPVASTTILRVFDTIFSPKISSVNMGAKEIFILNTSSNSFFNINYATGNLRFYYDQKLGFVVENLINNNPNLKNRINFVLEPNQSVLSLTSQKINNINQSFVGIGTDNPQYNLHVIGTTSLMNLIVSNNLNVSNINYSGGISVYKVSDQCNGAGFLTLEPQCQTIDRIWVNNQYVGKLIK